jgi:hypothetical protein
VLLVDICTRLSRADHASLWSTCQILRVAAAEVSMDRAKTKSTKLIREAMRWVAANPGLIVVAGSAALWVKLGRPRAWTPGDVDLFCVDASTLQPPPGVTTGSIIACCSDLNNHSIHSCRTPFGVLQIIAVVIGTTADEIMATFDLSCCKVALEATGPRTHAKYSYPAIVASLPPRGSAACEENLVTLEATAPRFNNPMFTDRLPPRGSVARGSMVDEYWGIQTVRTKRRVAKYMARGVTSVTYSQCDIPQLAFAMAYLPSLEYQHTLDMETKKTPRAVPKKLFHLPAGDYTSDYI